MDIKHVLKEHAYQNIPLSYNEAYALGEYALQGCLGDKLAQIQSIAALSALHTKATYSWRETTIKHGDHPNEILPSSAAEQIAGVCAAIFDRDIGESEFGFSSPRLPFVIDNCGMGGDLTVTANVSTIAALIAATDGIPMFKHGSPANADAGRHGSSDFIKLLGIDPFVPKDVMERCVEDVKFGYTEALDTRYKRIHALTHEIAKLPHMNDIIGPITSPVNPKILTRRVVGVNHLIAPSIIAETYDILNDRGITNMTHAFFVRGFVDKDGIRGMDEVSICPGGTQISELLDGRITEYTLSAEDFGIAAVSPESISPPHGMSKGAFSLKILEGEITGPPLQMVFANAALLFRLAEKAEDFREGYQLAESAFGSGKVPEIVNAVREALGVLATSS
jgi:anthranilate phosphoribosyltransferase